MWQSCCSRVVETNCGSSPSESPRPTSPMPGTSHWFIIHEPYLIRESRHFLLNRAVCFHCPAYAYIAPPVIWLCQHRGDWDMEARMAKVVEACRVANCLDLIEQWPQGFDTVSESQRLRYIVCDSIFLLVKLPLQLAPPHFKRCVCGSGCGQVIGERGAQLSGGQRARIALAR